MLRASSFISYCTVLPIFLILEHKYCEMIIAVSKETVVMLPGNRSVHKTMNCKAAPWYFLSWNKLPEKVHENCQQCWTTSLSQSAFRNSQSAFRNSQSAFRNSQSAFRNRPTTWYGLLKRERELLTLWADNHIHFSVQVGSRNWLECD